MTTLLQDLVPLLDKTFFDGVFEDSTHGSRQRFPQSRFPMNYSVDANKGTHIISYALAGFTKDEINIEIQNDDLKISAKRLVGTPYERHHSNEKGIDPIKFLHRGISESQLNVQWRIPKNLDIENINVSFENCILKLEIPTIQKETRKSKVLEIN